MITNAEAENRGYIKNKEWKSGTSFPEQFIYRCFLQLFPHTDNRYIESLCNMEFDVFVPELNLRIEFSGEHWHTADRSVKRDQMRRDFCWNNNMVYVEIIDRTEACDFRQETNGKHIVYTLHTGGNLQKMISMLVSIIKDILSRFNIIDTDIDYIRSIYEAYVFSAKYQYKIIKDTNVNLNGISYINAKNTKFNYFYKDSCTEMKSERLSLYVKDLPKEVIHTLDFHNSVPRLIFKDPVTKNTGTSSEILKAREQRLDQKEQELDNLEETLNKKLISLKKEIVDTEEMNNKLAEERDILQERVESLSVYKDKLIEDCDSYFEKRKARDKKEIELERAELALVKEELDFRKQQFEEELEELKKEMMEQVENEISMKYEKLSKDKKTYKEKLEAEYDEKLEAEKRDIARCEKSKYEYQLGKLTEENRKLMRQLMSAKFGLA